MRPSWTTCARSCGASCPASKRPCLSRRSAPTASAARRSSSTWRATPTRSLSPSAWPANSNSRSPYWGAAPTCLSAMKACRGSWSWHAASAARSTTTCCASRPAPSCPDWSPILPGRASPASSSRATSPARSAAPSSATPAPTDARSATPSSRSSSSTGASSAAPRRPRSASATAPASSSRDPTSSCWQPRSPCHTATRRRCAPRSLTTPSSGAASTRWAAHPAGVSSRTLRASCLPPVSSRTPD